MLGVGDVANPNMSHSGAVVMGSTSPPTVSGLRFNTVVLVGHGHTVMVPVSSFGHSGLVRVCPGLPKIGSPFSGSPILPVLGLIRIVRQEGVSVKVVLFLESDGGKVLVLPGTGRPLEGLVSVNCVVVAVDAMFVVNDAAVELYSDSAG